MVSPLTEDQLPERRLPGAGELVSALLGGLVDLGAGPVWGGLTSLVVMTANRADRLRNAAAEMAAQAGGAEELTTAIAEDETIEVLATNALDAAGRTAHRPKAILMARVVGRAVSDRALVDNAQLIHAAIAELEAPHINCLARMRAIERGLFDNSKSNADNAEIRSEAIVQASQREPVPVVSALIRTGVVHPATLASGGAAIYSLSDFGYDLLAQLDQIGEELHRSEGG